MSITYLSSMPKFAKPSFTKSDLIAEVNKQYKNLGRSEAKKVVNSIVNSITQALADKKRVEIRGFGTFGLRKYGARIGKNPQSGLPFEIKPKVLPFFKVGKMKTEINAATKDQS